MKITKFGILATMILIGISLMSNRVHAKELVYRPITLTVLDAETEQPLGGITVVVVNKVYYSIPFIVDYITGCNYHMYRYTTNENGIVQIPQYKYIVNNSHYLGYQGVTLNLDLVNKRENIKRQAERFDLYTSNYIGSDPYYDFFFRPRQEYKAGEYFCYPGGPVNWEQRDITRPYITVIPKRYEVPEEDKFRPNSFYCGY